MCEAKEVEIIQNRYILYYKINLLDAGNAENIRQFCTDLQQMFGMLKYRSKIVDSVAANEKMSCFIIERGEK